MDSRWSKLWLGAAFVAFLNLCATAAADPIPYPVLHRVALAGTAPVRALVAGAQGRDVYAAQGDRVLGLDPSGNMSASVTLSGQVVGLAAGNGDILYAVVQKPAGLVILHVNPLRVAATVPLRSGVPSAVLFDPLGDALYVESQGTGTVMRLDPTSGRPIAALRLGGELRQMAGDGRGTLYVANAAQNNVDVVDAKGMALAGKIPLTGCTAPSGLAMDAMGRRLFVACGNGQALIVDTDLDYTFERIAIGQGNSLRAAFAMRPFGAAGWKGGIFVTGDARLDAIRMNAFISYVDGGQLPLGGLGTALALNPKAGEVWVAVAPDGGAKPTLWVLGQTTGVSR